METRILYTTKEMGTWLPATASGSQEDIVDFLEIHHVERDGQGGHCFFPVGNARKHRASAICFEDGRVWDPYFAGFRPDGPSEHRAEYFKEAHGLALV